MSVFIHEQAVVDDDVKLGVATRVWQFASITRGTIMGKACSVSPFAMLDGSVYGDCVIVSGGVRAGAGFKVGDNVFLGPNVTLCNDMWPSSNKDGYDDATLRGNVRFAVIVGDGATLGANSVVLPGVSIGAGAVIAAGAVVDRNVPEMMLWRRNGYLCPVPSDMPRKRMRWAK